MIRQKLKYSTVLLVALIANQKLYAQSVDGQILNLSSKNPVSNARINITQAADTSHTISLISNELGLYSGELPYDTLTNGLEEFITVPPVLIFKDGNVTIIQIDGTQINHEQNALVFDLNGKAIDGINGYYDGNIVEFRINHKRYGDQAIIFKAGQFNGTFTHKGMGLNFNHEWTPGPDGQNGQPISAMKGAQSTFIDYIVEINNLDSLYQPYSKTFSMDLENDNIITNYLKPWPTFLAEILEQIKTADGTTIENALSVFTQLNGSIVDSSRTDVEGNIARSFAVPNWKQDRLLADTLQFARRISAQGYYAQQDTLKITAGTYDFNTALTKLPQDIFQHRIIGNLSPYEGDIQLIGNNLAYNHTQGNAYDVTFENKEDTTNVRVLFNNGALYNAIDTTIRVGDIHTLDLALEQQIQEYKMKLLFGPVNSKAKVFALHDKENPNDDEELFSKEYVVPSKYNIDFTSLNPDEAFRIIVSNNEAWSTIDDTIQMMGGETIDRAFELERVNYLHHFYLKPTFLPAGADAVILAIINPATQEYDTIFSTNNASGEEYNIQHDSQNYSEIFYVKVENGARWITKDTVFSMTETGVHQHTYSLSEKKLNQFQIEPTFDPTGSAAKITVLNDRDDPTDDEVLLNISSVEGQQYKRTYESYDDKEEFKVELSNGTGWTTINTIEDLVAGQTLSKVYKLSEIGDEPNTFDLYLNFGPNGSDAKVTALNNLEDPNDDKVLYNETNVSNSQIHLDHESERDSEKFLVELSNGTGWTTITDDVTVAANSSQTKSYQLEEIIGSFPHELAGTLTSEYNLFWIKANGKQIHSQTSGSNFYIKINNEEEITDVQYYMVKGDLHDTINITKNVINDTGNSFGLTQKRWEYFIEALAKNGANIRLKADGNTYNKIAENGNVDFGRMLLDSDNEYLDFLATLVNYIDKPVNGNYAAGSHTIDLLQTPISGSEDMFATAQGSVLGNGVRALNNMIVTYILQDSPNTERSFTTNSDGQYQITDMEIDEEPEKFIVKVTGNDIVPYEVVKQLQDGTNTINLTPRMLDFVYVKGKLLDTKTGAGLGNKPIKLENLSGTILASTTTDGNGNYMFPAIDEDQTVFMSYGGGSHKAMIDVPVRIRDATQPSDTIQIIGDLDLIAQSYNTAQVREMAPDYPNRYAKQTQYVYLENMQPSEKEAFWASVAQGEAYFGSINFVEVDTKRTGSGWNIELGSNDTQYRWGTANGITVVVGGEVDIGSGEGRIKELFGRTHNFGNVTSRGSFMNPDATLPTSLDIALYEIINMHVYRSIGSGNTQHQLKHYLSDNFE